MYITLQQSDLERTVGINTDYIETTDFKMEDVDREFCYAVFIYELTSPPYSLTLSHDTTTLANNMTVQKVWLFNLVNAKDVV